MARQTLDLATLQQSISNPKASKLQELVQRKLTDDRLGLVVDAMLERAEKKGDTRGARIRVEAGRVYAGMPQTIVVNQFVDSGYETQRVVVGHRGEMAPEQKIVAYLSVSGPVTPELIASQTGLDKADVVRCLDSNPSRFGVDGKNYFLVGPKSRA